MRRVLAVLSFLVVSLIPFTALGTAQFGESLIFEGEETTMYATPLEDYFELGHDRPDVFLESGMCTALWRGYVGTWLIRDDRLYLEKIHIDACGEKPREIPLSTIFAGHEGPIPADWYSGILRLPRGKVMMYVHMGWASQFEEDVLILIEKGRVMGKKVIDNRIKTEEELYGQSRMTYEEIFEQAQ